MTSSVRVESSLVSFRLWAGLIAFFLTLGGSPPVRAQLAGCPPQLAQTVGWQKGFSILGTDFPTEIAYDVSRLGQPEQGQAIAAFTAWNNSPSNCLHVNFVRRDGSSANITVEEGSASGAAAETTLVSIGSELLVATTVMDLDNSIGAHFVRGNDAQFRVAVLKAMLHEIGHTMGLGDEPIDRALGCVGKLLV